GAGEFVLLDDALQVLLATGDCDQADLRVRSHDLAVEVEARLGVLAERSLPDQALEVLVSLRVNFGGIKIGSGWQINLRFADVEEAERIPGRELPRLLGGHHVVGQLANAGGEL